MQNLVSIWLALELRKKAIILGATLAMFLAILGLARIANTPRFELLYAGLEAANAGEIVAALEQRGIAHQVRGDSIYVDQGQRDSLRMALAAQGLPAASSAGYELLDQLTGFGATSQMFDAAYWRAKEGELARTILAVPEVKAARVHLGQAPDSVFRRDQQPSASVTLTTTMGTLSKGQADALRHLVASAVAGMKPADVQIIDTVAGLIAGPEADASTGAAQERAEEIRHNVQRLLEARVGPGKAVVEVSLDLITESEQITERTFDPQSRVPISSETQERSETAQQPGGAVTVASNLPEGDAGGGSPGQSQSSETTERVNYEVSETQREVMRGPGGVRRMTVAVLVDGQMTPQPDGSQIWAPRPPEELEVLRELVASAVGLEEARGDVLTLKSLEFQAVTPLGVQAETGVLSTLGQLDLMAAIQIAALTLVALVLGLFVIRPVLKSGSLAALPAPAPPLALSRVNAEPALTGEIDDGFQLPDLPVMDFMSGLEDPPAEDAATRLRRLIEERQVESLEILRGWLEPEEERA
ncbi:flagellar basal-body MS-ring/collar protein FliF [Xinfangfangia sp. CPCC 101601]|uniref:Flagellar M-ring protein n=1 Tax=Pseudogemmobacter lacusdianii TaxID=3069608 RepID=A0ABU0VU97_9RHOB|nr:flagellar basal-body MS-ring/collar protein FliF [Xinfangfangia sp. CPCC 101601]MDQ2065283.1 flagellar basal-body MS-ring/collar protein FliF [Xinfangfangia sp. CPCC 101601]